jgi:DNA-binding protein H-NS
MRMPRHKQEFPDQSVQELQQQLAQLEADKKALEAALRKQRAAELTDFANGIKEQITERGYSINEVFSLLTKGRRNSKGAGGPKGRRYVDPDNPDNTYSRGPLPAWMKERMLAAGYNPEDKAHREEFKTSHLEVVA